VLIDPRIQLRDLRAQKVDVLEQRVEQISVMRPDASREQLR
jgi:hypothetical protein